MAMARRAAAAACAGPSAAGRAARARVVASMKHSQQQCQQKCVEEQDHARWWDMLWEHACRAAVARQRQRLHSRSAAGSGRAARSGGACNGDAHAAQRRAAAAAPVQRALRGAGRRARRHHTFRDAYRIAPARPRPAAAGSDLNENVELTLVGPRVQGTFVLLGESKRARGDFALAWAAETRSPPRSPTHLARAADHAGDQGAPARGPPT